MQKNFINTNDFLSLLKLTICNLQLETPAFTYVNQAVSLVGKLACASISSSSQLGCIPLLLNIFVKCFCLIGLGVIYGLLACGFFIFWDKSIGLHMVAITMFSAVINLSIKFAYVGPRPYWTDSRVRGMSTCAYGVQKLILSSLVFFFSL